MAGVDFSNICVNITVPAAATNGAQTYTIPKFVTVVDDLINEVEQTFAIVATIQDVPFNCSVPFQLYTEVIDCNCFQSLVGESCLGRSGVTEIWILDNDSKLKFMPRHGIKALFFFSYGHWIH